MTSSRCSTRVAATPRLPRCHTPFSRTIGAERPASRTASSSRRRTTRPRTEGSSTIRPTGGRPTRA
jgi:hypothetical protein